MEHQTTLNAKIVHIALKHDDGLASLMKRYAFERPEQLFEAIRRVTPLPEAERLIRRIKKKYRVECKSGTIDWSNQVQDSDKEMSLEESDTQELSLKQEEQSAEMCDNFLSSNLESEGEEVTSEEVDELDELRAKALEISQELCNLELSHKELVARRRQLLGKFTQKKTRLEELKALIEKEEMELEILYNEYSECASQMSALNEEQASEKDELDSIRKRIEILEKIVLYVYEDGTIEVENADLPSVSDDEARKLLMELVSNSSVNSAVFGMTIYQLNCIAKLILVKQVLNNEGKSFEIEFESASMRTLWQSFAE